ncbi:MAG TPA: DUF5615 family PIN-like protein [Chloroflexota bacterium]|nr:DUF5615 family PIN-like protein [Chloroflexota bacterium]
MDEHVPSTVSEGLRRRGIDVLTAQEAGLRGAQDEDHLALAAREERTIVTQGRLLTSPRSRTSTPRRRVRAATDAAGRDYPRIDAGL